MNSMSLHTSLQSACITHADAEWPPQSIRALIPSFDSRSQAVLAGYDAVLEWQSSRWQLTCLTADMSASPVFSEFVTGKARYRRTHGGKEALVQALRIAHTARGSVVDAAVVDTTAGLGRDAFILASHGFQVTLLERVPAIAWLLWDGLRRARDDANVSAIVDRMLLHVVDALTWLQAQADQSIMSLYLDPMFPQRKKKARVKKDMHVFHCIVGEDHDSGAVLSDALRVAQRRVVVKRPRLAEPLVAVGAFAGVMPHHRLVGKANRFDVYHVV